MAVERNIIFLYPLAPVVNELKKQLEENESYTVYEMDSIGEYKQLIGILEYSVTFSTDLKKTSRYLQENDKLLKSLNAKNYTVNNKTLPPHVIVKLQKYGLDEYLKDSIPAKSLMFKVETFFNAFDAKAEQEQLEKQKAVTGMMIMNKNQPKEENTNDKQRIEKMAIMDDESSSASEPTKKNIDLSGIDDGGSQLNRKKVNSMDGLLGSPFDNMQRKSVEKNNATNDGPKYKKSDFSLDELPAGEKKKNGFKAVDQEYGSGSGKKFEAVDIDAKKKQAKFNEVDIERKKGKKFVPVDQDLKKRKVDFKPVDVDYDKKRKQFKELEQEAKKRKKFEEVDRDLNKKKHDFKEVDRDLNKKKHDFKEVDRDLDKKKSNFEEVELDLNKKKANFEEVDGELKKKKNNITDIDLGLNKKKNNFKEHEGDLNKKKHSFEEINPEDKERKKLDEIEIALNKKKGFEETSIDLNKKTNTFEEVEAQKKKRKTFEEVEIDRSLKGIKDSELDDATKNRKTFEEVDIERDKKDAIALELESNKKKGEQELALNEDKDSLIDKILKHDKKDWGEQTIDYRTMRIEQAQRKAQLRSEDQEKLDRALADKIALIDEIEYFYPGTYGIEFLVHHSSFSMNKEFENINLLKFVHFSLMKEMNSIVSYFVIKDQNPVCVYDGHIDSDTEKYEMEPTQYFEENLEQFFQIELPTWKDESFQSKINEFIFPFHNDGKKHGFAVAHFYESVTGHFSAIKAELLLMSSKGAILAMAQEEE